MAKPKKQSNEEQVMEYLQKLDHPLLDTVNVLRAMIAATDPIIGEEIKWNSPSFYYTGEMQPFDPKEYKRDIVVFNLHKKDAILLVFPTGAKVNDSTGLLEGKYTDGRRIVKITDVADAKNKEKALQQVIRAWLKLVDK